MDFDNFEEATVTILEGTMKDGQLNGEYTFVEWTGDSYTGSVRCGKPDGKGRKFRQNGEFAEGEFKNGTLWSGRFRWSKEGVLSQGEILNGQIWEGRGSKVVNGSEMSGEFKNGLLNGFGKIIHPNGKSAEGEFRDGQLFNGVGAVFIDGLEYECQFVEGRAEGPVVVYQQDSSLIFRGTFKSGHPWEGVGQWTKDKVTEIGAFRGGLLQGRGRRVVDGRIHIGNFQDGKLTGLGAIVGPRNHLTIGKFENDKLVSGKRLTDWRMEEGKFRGDKLCGRGIIRFIPCHKRDGQLVGVLPQEFDNYIEECLDPEGSLQDVMDLLCVGESSAFIEGEFLDGFLDGQGRQSMCGTVSVGHFKSGKLNGKGCRTFPDGRVESGVFLDGVLVQAPPLGHPGSGQRVTLDDGTIFEGQWPTGFGTLTRCSGFKEEGFFDRGELIDGKIKIQFTSSASMTVDYKDGLPTPDYSFSNTNYQLDAKVLNDRVCKIVNLNDGAGNPIEAEVLFGNKSTRNNFVTSNGSLIKGSVSNGQPQKGFYMDYTGAVRNGRYDKKLMSDGQVDWEGFHLTFNDNQLKHVSHAKREDRRIERATIRHEDGQVTSEYALLGTVNRGVPDGPVVLAGPTWFEECEYSRGVRNGNFKEFMPWQFCQAYYQKGRQVGPGFGVSETFEIYCGIFTDYGCYKGISRYGFRVEQGEFKNWALHGRGRVSFHGGAIEGVWEEGKLVEVIRIIDESGYSVEGALARGDEDGEHLVVRPNGTLIFGTWANGQLVSRKWETTVRGMKLVPTVTHTGEEKIQLEGPCGLVESGDFTEALVLNGGGFRQWKAGVIDRGVFSDGVLKLREVINVSDRSSN